MNLYDRENIFTMSAMLGNAIIRCGDFEDACKDAQREDFVFFDSPYYDTFDTYQAGGFSDDDHMRLARLFKILTARGVWCMLTNSDTDFIRSLYRGYHIDTVVVRRSVNRNGDKRKGTEVIVRNYRNIDPITIMITPQLNAWN